MAEEKIDRRRRHGSTAVFVAVDYIFLFIFFGFLCYFVFQILPASTVRSSSSPG